LSHVVEWQDESLLTFESIPFSTIPNVDWLFFYSQQGASKFFAQYKAPIKAKIAAFGPKTGAALKKLGYSPDFVGTGSATNTSRAFTMIARQEKVLFARARNSRKSLQEEMKDDVEIIDLIVYDNKARKDVRIPKCDMYIFTSPLNAKTYYASHEKKQTDQVIAIGETTRQTLRDLGISEVQIPSHPSETAIGEIVKRYFRL